MVQIHTRWFGNLDPLSPSLLTHLHTLSLGHMKLLSFSLLNHICTQDWLWLLFQPCQIVISRQSNKGEKHYSCIHEVHVHEATENCQDMKGNPLDPAGQKGGNLKDWLTVWIQAPILKPMRTEAELLALSTVRNWGAMWTLFSIRKQHYKWDRREGGMRWDVNNIFTCDDIKL